MDSCGDIHDITVMDVVVTHVSMKTRRSMINTTIQERMVVVVMRVRK